MNLGSRLGPELLVLWLALIPSTAGWSPASAQGLESTVQLNLMAQIPWNTPSQPRLTMSVAATNGEQDALSNVTVEATIFTAVHSRSEYVQSLTADVGTPLRTLPLAGPTTLPPAASAAFELHADIGFLDQQADEARVYPVLVELRSGDRSLAAFRTPVIFLPSKPKTPLGLTWTFIIGHPIAFTPDGTFQGRDLERRLEPAGSLGGAITAIRQMVRGGSAEPVNVVVSPTLLEDLVRMQDGYQVRVGDTVQTVPAGEGGAASATDALDRLRAIATAGRAELSAMPYGVPDLAQLQRSGLADDIPPQIAGGQRWMDQVLEVDGDGSSPSRETQPSEVFRPPGSSLDPKVLTTLRSLGVRTLLMSAGSVEQPAQDKGFAPPALVTVSAGDTDLDAVVPDAGLDALIGDPVAQSDPRLGTQVILGDLASIWLEQPDTPRAVAIAIGPEQRLPAAFFASFVRTVATAPWIRPVKASQLATRFSTAGSEPYAESRVDPIGDRYLEQLDRDRALIAQWGSAVADEREATMQTVTLTRELYLAEGSYLVQREDFGWRWLRDIEGRVIRGFSDVRVDTQQIVTLTSSGGRIPVRVTNRGGDALQVQVALVSTHLTFPDGGTRGITLQPGQTQVVVFEASARTTGTFGVRVDIRSPDGQTISDDATVLVRSTAYSRIALVITVTAMAVLVVAWFRRSRTRGKRRGDAAPGEAHDDV